jgi:Protein of unknown function (DUF2851)
MASTAAAGAPYPEALLQYAWQHRRYQATSLLTTDRQPVVIVRLGQRNSGAGPDFVQAQVRIGKLEFHGHVELHVRGTDWYTHGHDTDPAYNPVVLHVVGQASTKKPLRSDGTSIPELVLGDRLDADLLVAYGKLVAQNDQLPCAAQFPTVDPFVRKMWFASQGHARLLEKADQHRSTWQAAGADWRQALFVALAGAIGGPTNRAAFENLAMQVGYTRLAAQRDQPHGPEALLLGAAGLLDQPATDAYTAALAQHWAHYQRLYGLVPLAPGVVSFGRMRPAAFPTLRLAQLAAFVRHQPDWLALLGAPAKQLAQWLQLAPDPYWTTHYRFGKPTQKPISGTLGAAQVQHILINTLLPFAVFYHNERGDSAAVAAAGEQLSTLPPEDHALARIYASLGFEPQSALDTQGAVYLHRHYCTPRRCLNCAIGHSILQPNPA